MRSPLVNSRSRFCGTAIKDIVDSQSQTDPSFKTRRLYTRMSAAEVRRQLIEQKGYTDEGLPSRQTINAKLRELGYYPKSVAKSKPNITFDRAVITA